MQPARNICCNLLLRALSDGDFARLQIHLQVVRLEAGMLLARASQPIEDVYFLESGIATLAVGRPNAGSVEVGVIGFEGMVGSPGLLHAGQSPHNAQVYSHGGKALKIGLRELLAICGESETLRSLLLRYAHTMMMQTAAGVVSNAHLRLDARLARWLLMCHDRVDGNEINFTHESMAAVIGAQRTGVTVALHIMEGEGAIRSKRGRVIILDRALLVKVAGEAYGMPEAEYRRLIGHFGRSPAPAPEQKMRLGGIFFETSIAFPTPCSASL